MWRQTHCSRKSRVWDLNPTADMAVNSHIYLTMADAIPHPNYNRMFCIIFNPFIKGSPLSFAMCGESHTKCTLKIPTHFSVRVGDVLPDEIGLNNRWPQLGRVTCTVITWTRGWQWVRGAYRKHVHTPLMSHWSCILNVHVWMSSAAPSDDIWYYIYISGVIQFLHVFPRWLENGIHSS